MAGNRVRHGEDGAGLGAQDASTHSPPHDTDERTQLLGRLAMQRHIDGPLAHVG